MTIIATLNANTLAALYPFTAVKDVRYYLGGVYIEPNKTEGITAVATNGHVILAVNDTAGTCEAPVIISFESTLVTQMKKHNAGLATITRISPDLPGVTISLESGFSGPGTIIDGRYPDYQAVMPGELASEPAAYVAYDPQYISKFCVAEKVLRPMHKAHGLQIVNGADNRAGCIVFPFISDTVSARGVIMPLRSDAATYTG